MTRKTPKTAMHLKPSSQAEGKGWYVAYRGTGKKECNWVATIGRPSEPKKCVGVEYTRERAVEMAICAARKAGTLNWAATVRWVKEQGIEIDISRTINNGTNVRKRGWFVSHAGNGYYNAFVGKAAAGAQWVGQYRTYAGAVKYAVEAAKDKGCYDEMATRLFFERRELKMGAVYERVNRIAS